MADSPDSKIAAPDSSAAPDSTAAPDSSAAPDPNEISWWLLAAFALHMAAIALVTTYSRSHWIIWMSYAGMFYAQACLLGMWLGIGSPHVLLRAVVSCSLLACVIYACFVAGWADVAGMVRWGVAAMLTVACAFVSLRKSGLKVASPAPPDVPASYRGLPLGLLAKALLPIVGLLLVSRFLLPDTSTVLVGLRFGLLSLAAALMILSAHHGATKRAIFGLPALALAWAWLDPFRQAGVPALEPTLWIMGAYAAMTSLTLLPIRWAGYRLQMIPLGFDSLALRMLRAKDIEGARRALAVAIEREPESPATWYAQSRIAFEEGKNEEALEAISDVLSLMPDSIFALNTRSDICRKLGAFEQAEADVTRIIELKPKLVSAAMLYSDRADVRMRRKDGAGAMTDLNEALRLERNLGFALRNRSEIYALACEYEKALEDAEKAVAVEPTHALGFNFRGWCLAVGPASMRDPVRALADARRAMELIEKKDSSRALVIATLAAALASVGDYPAAIEKIQEALAEVWDAEERTRILEMQAAFQAGKPYIPKPAFVLP